MFVIKKKANQSTPFNDRILTDHGFRLENDVPLSGRVLVFDSKQEAMAKGREKVEEYFMQSSRSFSEALEEFEQNEGSLDVGDYTIQIQEAKQ